MDEIDLRDGNGKHRAEDAQPQGFVPSHLAAPALRDRAQQRTALEYAALGLGEIRAGAATLDGPVAEMIGIEAAQLQRLLRALAAGMAPASPDGGSVAYE